MHEDVARQLESLGLRFGSTDRDRYLDAGWWRRDATFVDDFARAAVRDPSRTAVVSHRVGEPTRRLSYAELDDIVDRVATGLVDQGIVPGDVVSLQLPNWWEFVAIALACGRVGAIVSPLVPIHRRREVEFAVRLAEARLLFVPASFRGFGHGEMACDLARAVPTLRAAVVVDGETAGALDFTRDFLSKPPLAGADRRPAPPDAVAELLFTSGTTGEQKCVAHTHNTQFARARAMYEPLALDGEDTVLMASTLGHSSGFLYGFVVPMTLGMTTVLQDVWDPDVMLALVEQERVTWSMGATTFLVDAVRAQRERPRTTSSLRLFVSGGAAIPPQLVRDVRDALGARLIAVWGMTENGGVTVTPIDDSFDAAAQSDGQAVPWMELAIQDETGGLAAPGVAGGMIVRGASQTPGYLHRPDLYRASLDGDGWFSTGDVGRLDERGNLRVVGRTKDLINRGGENIPVAEVEAVLLSHMAIREVAVVACPDERLGERACAVVVAEDGAHVTLDDLRRHLAAAGMSKTYWPERLEIFAELPRTLSGKIQKFRLRELVTTVDPTESVR